MKLEVTKKDLQLIKVAVTLLVAIVCVRFLVMPALENVQTAKTELDTVEMEAEEWQYEIDRISSLESRKDVLTTQLAELEAPYYGSMESQEIDELVTGIALNHNLFPVNLSIGDQVMEVPAAYLYAETAADSTDETETTDASAEESTEDTEDADASAEESSEDAQTAKTASAAGYLTQNAVSFTIQGSETDVMAFLDDLDKNYPSIQVQTFTLSTGNYLDTQMEQVQITTLNCSLVVFTCDEQ